MSRAGHLVGITTDRFGSELTADLAINDTEVQVASTLFFNEREGGTLLFLDGTTLAYEAFDDPDTDDDSVGDDDGPTTLTLTAPSRIAADEGDRVYELDTTTGQDGDPVQELTALVTIDDRDGGDALPARVRAGLVDQLDSDFETYIGKAVELEHRGGELVLIDILGSKRTGAIRFENTDSASATGPGPVPVPLTYRPIIGSIHVYWNGDWQPPTQWTLDGWTLTFLDPDGYVRKDDPLDVAYAHTDPTRGSGELVPFGSAGWSYKMIAATDSTDYSDPDLDDSAWPVGSCAFGSDNQGGGAYDAYGGYKTAWPLDGRIWLRRTFGPLTSATVAIRIDNFADVYWNGELLGSFSHTTADLEDYNDPYSVAVPSDLLMGDVNVLAVKVTDDTAPVGIDNAIADVQVTMTRRVTV